MVATMGISFYICTVKNQERHEVAATCSVFCAQNLLENSKRIEWGRSNRPKVFALDYLTARNALYLCLKN
jgi:hypothetical protein